MTKLRKAGASVHDGRSPSPTGRGRAATQACGHQPYGTSVSIVRSARQAWHGLQSRFAAHSSQIALLQGALAVASLLSIAYGIAGFILHHSGVSPGGLNGVAQVATGGTLDTLADEVITGVTGAVGLAVAGRRLRRRRDWRAFIESLHLPAGFGWPDPGTMHDGWTATASRSASGQPRRQWVKAGAPPRDALVIDQATERLNEMFDPRPIESRGFSSNGGTICYLPDAILGSGSFGTVQLFRAVPAPQIDSKTGDHEYPAAFALKLFTVKACETWSELDVMRILEEKAGLLMLIYRSAADAAALLGGGGGGGRGAGHNARAVLTSRLFPEVALTDPPAAVGVAVGCGSRSSSSSSGSAAAPAAPLRLGIVAMEPARPLHSDSARDSSMLLKLSWRDAAAVARAAFEDMARYAGDAGLIFVDCKAENVLWFERGGAAAPLPAAPAASADGLPSSPVPARARATGRGPVPVQPGRVPGRSVPENGGTAYTVLVADLGSLYRAGAQQWCSSYYSPHCRTGGYPVAHVGLCAFQLGWLIIELLKPRAEDPAAWEISEYKTHYYALAELFSNRLGSRQEPAVAVRHWETLSAILVDELRAPRCFVDLLDALLCFNRATREFLPTLGAFEDSVRNVRDVFNRFEEAARGQQGG